MRLRPNGQVPFLWTKINRVEPWLLALVPSGGDWKKCCLTLSNVCYGVKKNKHTICKIPFESKRIKGVPPVFLSLKFPPTGATILPPNIVNYCHGTRLWTRISKSNDFGSFASLIRAKRSRKHTRMMKILKLLEAKSVQSTTDSEWTRSSSALDFSVPQPYLGCRNPY